MQLTLYENFSKKRNSTKRPTGGTTIEVKMKENTSINTPVFIIKGINLNYNYCYLASVNRYYFITDITLQNNEIYELSCVTDVLATYKNQIGNYTAFVERSASNYDSFVNDPALSMQQYIVNKRKVNTNISEFSSSGCYLVRTIASNSDTETGINTYCMTKGQLSTFINNAFNVGNYGDIFTELVDELVKAVFNPFDYIASVSWIPFTATTFSGTTNTTNVKLGWWTLSNVSAYPVTNDAFGIVKTVTKPPEYFQDFRDYNPSFTKCTMWLTGVGLIDLDPRELKPESNLYVMYYIDCATGQANVYLRSGQSADTSQSIASYPATLCAPVQLSQTSLNVEGVASNGLTSMASAVSGNMLQTSVAGVNAILDATKPTTRVIGSQGNRASITAYMDIYIELTQYGSKEFPLTVAGRPCCKNLQLNTLSGYIKCGGASIDIVGLGSDKEEVNTLLNNGFYYE